VPLYNREIGEIRNELACSWICLQIDEARLKSQAIYLIMVGKLSGSLSKPYLLDCLQVHRSANNLNAMQAFLEALEILRSDRKPYENVRLLLSDQASYMVLAAENLRQGLFSKMLHVICLCHSRQRVCEDIKFAYQREKRLVTNLKTTLARAPRRVAIFGRLTHSKLGIFPVVGNIYSLLQVRSHQF